MDVTTTPQPPKASSRHFYRYGEFSGERRDWLREVIVDHLLYAPTVRELNDPADARVKLAPLSANEMYHFLYNGPFGVLARNPHLSVDEQVREAIVLEINIQQHGPQLLTQQLQTILNSRNEMYRVYSLSKRYNNLSLWAKYAANHTGYCLEFANQGPFFGSAKEVVYTDIVELDINNSEELDGYWLYCKRCEWSNEEEIRVVLPPPFASKGKIDAHSLTRVILGSRMQEADRHLITQWASERVPQLSVVYAYYDSSSQTLKLRT